MKKGFEPYKGVRDFYPEEQFIQRYIFDVWRRVAEAYGYEEYSASLLESTELYAAKSSQEIVSEQTYTFDDRGGRSVTLRPEMTPTVARMIAARTRELSFPLRWYSLPNVFRYERPQRGRLREHWQLNADLFGVASVAGDAEIIMLGVDIMRLFGARPEEYEVRVSNRRLITTVAIDCLGLDVEVTQALIRLIDKKAKIERGAFEKELGALLNDHLPTVLPILEATTLDALQEVLPCEIRNSEWLSELKELFATLAEYGVENVRLDPTLVRGFDYYTDMVFEIFDTSPENNRSLFGGGRYNNLLADFGAPDTPAVGFGMGDVTIRDFLATHDLLPAYRPATELHICTLDESTLPAARALADKLRRQGIAVETTLSKKRIGEQITHADKKRVPFFLCIGPEETASGVYLLKHLPTGKEQKLTVEEIAHAITRQLMDSNGTHQHANTRL